TALAGDFPQVRIDFYETPDGRVLFGEYTFYHWSGFVPFDPDEADERLGAYFKIP
ncbi:MAG: glycosyl transferase, partial [Bacteroidales bacterium]|nr:glycosyl transferase [Bacteroidales bacterium]